MKMYLTDFHFVDIGRKCGLLPKNENRVAALIKNKAHSLLRKNTKYNTMFIWGYRDGQRMDKQHLTNIITHLKLNMPVWPSYRKNAIVQIAGLELMYREKFGNDG
jgi:hypothetical protein